jgi:glycosyltransferase involved in cell wall biosynthesis
MATNKYSATLFNCKSQQNHVNLDSHGFNQVSILGTSVSQLSPQNLGKLLRSAILDSEYLVISHNCCDIDSSILDALINQLENDEHNSIVIYPGLASKDLVLIPEHHKEIPFDWFNTGTQGFTSNLLDWPVQVWNLRKIRDTGIMYFLALELTNSELINKIAGLGFRGKVSGRVITRLSPECFEATKHICALSSTQPHIDRLEKYFIDHKETTGRKPKVLLDATGLPPWVNGTSVYINRALRNLVDDEDFDIQIVGNPESFKFHGTWLEYGDRVITNPPTTLTYDLAIKLDQPWDLTQLQKHSICALNVIYVMYDIISLDISALNVNSLYETWEKMALTSDSVIYISEYTMRVFNDRFSEPIRSQVISPSMVPSEYFNSSSKYVPSDKKNILVVGNKLPHKDVDWVTEQLQKSYPDYEISTFFGGLGVGILSEEQVVSRYLSADVVVFPSLYEGFGNPIFESLSLGKHVIARRSSHNLDLKSHLKNDLHLYDSLSELFQLVDQILNEQVPLELDNHEKYFTWENHFYQLKTEMLNVIEHADSRQRILRRTILNA